MMVPFGLILTNSVPMIEAMMRGDADHDQGNRSDTSMLSAAECKVADEHGGQPWSPRRSRTGRRAMPAQSPTLSPTLSAMTAGLRGSSSGMPASTLPTRSAPTSAAFVKMPPPRRANTEMSELAEAQAHERRERGDAEEHQDRHDGHRKDAEADHEHARGDARPCNGPRAQGMTATRRAEARTSAVPHARARPRCARTLKPGSRPRPRRPRRSRWPSTRRSLGNAQEPGRQKHDGHNDAHDGDRAVLAAHMYAMAPSCMADAMPCICSLPAGNSLILPIKTAA